MPPYDVQKHINQQPAERIAYCINLWKTGDNARNVYGELIALCDLFGIRNHPGAWMEPYYLIPEPSTDLKELEAFMVDCNIIANKVMRPGWL